MRSHDTSMPDTPGVVFEDCTIVGPDNALQVGYPGFEGYSRVKFQGCRLIVLNFSQPHGTPATGIVYSDLTPKPAYVAYGTMTELLAGAHVALCLRQLAHGR